MTKRYLSMGIMATLLLSACNMMELPHELKPMSSDSQVSTKSYTLAASHWSDVAKIRAEANRLGLQVRAGKMTKVQAAQHLNRFRINLVGRNIVDDSVYDVYLQAAVDSQRGEITNTQSRAYVENALRGWQQRWPNMDNKPKNPAFTNFLLEFMGMTPLR
ncbi:hypothetical protein [Wielerella bovis]|uniref:hypothetical protein n=1 Tax=Wielerella bovis TaxID=2917790 RepID=UPI003D2AA4D3